MVIILENRKPLLTAPLREASLALRYPVSRGFSLEWLLRGWFIYALGCIKQTN